MGLYKIRLTPQGFLEVGDGAVQFFVLCQRDAVVDPRLDIIGVVFERLFEFCECQRRLARTQIEHCQRVVHAPVGRVGSDQHLIAVDFL